MVDARAVIVPKDEGILHRAKSLGIARPRQPMLETSIRALTTSRMIPVPFVAAMLGRWDRRCAARALVIGQVTGVRGLPRPVRPRFFVVPTAAFSASRCPFESPEVQMIQQARTDTQTKSARDAFVNGLITSLW